MCVMVLAVAMVKYSSEILGKKQVTWLEPFLAKISFSSAIFIVIQFLIHSTVISKFKLVSS